MPLIIEEQVENLGIELFQNLGYQYKNGYEIKGEVKFNGESLSELSTEERAQKGIFLAFQYPLEIPGVNTNIFLKTSLNS